MPRPTLLCKDLSRLDGFETPSAMKTPNSARLQRSQATPSESNRPKKVGRGGSTSRRSRKRRGGGVLRKLSSVAASGEEGNNHHPGLVSDAEPEETKPREERSYKDFFPDLDLSAPILIVVNNSQEIPADQDATHVGREVTMTECGRENAEPSYADKRETLENGTETPEEPSVREISDSRNREKVSTEERRERGQDISLTEEANVGGNDATLNEKKSDIVEQQQPPILAVKKNQSDISPSAPPESSNSVTLVNGIDVNPDQDSDCGRVHESNAEVVERSGPIAADTPESAGEMLPSTFTERPIDDDADGQHVSTTDESPTLEEESTSDIVGTHATQNPFQALSTRPPHRVVGSKNSFMTPAAMKELPRPTFRAVDGMELLRTAADDVLNGSTQPYYGREPFRRPEGHYVRYVEPTEMELAERVEYDMDEQDKCWLNVVNAERKAEGVPAVSSEIFERIMDRLEKEWFDLTKDLQKAANHKEDPLSAEDSACSICDDGECENSNAIVFCDGCNLAVHQDCYGIPYIPEGQWLCRKCMLSPENPVKCIFCPNEGGAFKQTTTSQWAHLLCALWIPEVGVSNHVYMEPIDQINEVPKSRWRLTCYICKKRSGACIQCDNKSCFTAFHVTCARKARLYMRMKSHNAHYDHGTLKAYCDKHTPRDFRGQEDVTNAQKLLGGLDEEAKTSRTPKSTQKKKPKEESDDESYDPECNNSEESNSGRVRPRGRFQAESSARKSSSSLSWRGNRHSTDSGGGTDAPTGTNTSVASPCRKSKSAQAHEADYKANGTVTPQYIVHRAAQQLSRYQVRKKSAFLNLVCRYWSLKREARRGAPLLKRLHLEPWTASSTAHKQTEEDKARKFQAVVHLRKDLEKKRTLAEMIRKREKSKLERAQIVKAYFDHIFYPLGRVLQPLMEQLQKADSRRIFAEPVSVEDVPDYFNVIKTPLDFGVMSKQLQEHYYTSINQFAIDVNLVYDNCMLYNRPDTIFYKIAQRLKKALPKLIEDAENEYASMPVDQEVGISTIPIDPCIFKVEWDGVQSTIPKYTRTAAEQEAALLAERLAEEKKAKEEAAIAAANKATAEVVEALSTPRRRRGRNDTMLETPTPSINLRSQKKEEQVIQETPTPSVNLRSKKTEILVMPPPLLPARRSTGISSAPPKERKSTRRMLAMTFTKSLQTGRFVKGNMGRKFEILVSKRYAGKTVKRGKSVPIAEKKKETEILSPYSTRRSTRIRNVIDAEVDDGSTAEAIPMQKEKDSDSASVNGKGVDKRRGSKSRRVESEIPPSTEAVSSTKQDTPKKKRGRPRTKPEIIQDEDHAEESDPNDMKRRRSSRHRKSMSVEESDTNDTIRTRSSRYQESVGVEQADANYTKRRKLSNLQNSKSVEESDSNNTKRTKSSRHQEVKRVEESDSDSTGRKSLHSVTADERSTHTSRTTSRRTSVSGTIAPGSLVWAKMTGYPWFPAEVIDPQTSKTAVPDVVIQSRLEGEDYLVQYFDVEPQRRLWKWVGKNKVVPFGASDETDGGYLRSAKAKLSQKKKVWQAFEAACVTVGRDPTRLLNTLKEPRSKESTPKKDG